MMSRWTPEQLARAQVTPATTIPVIAADRHAATAGVPGLDLWDLWPVTTRDGAVAEFAGESWWMVLSAPHAPDPEDRHHGARIRLLARAGDRWRDLGNLLPDALTPGTREWAGSAVIEGDALRLYYTVVGRRDAPFSFEQRLMTTVAPLAAGARRPDDWIAPVELVAPDGLRYQDTATSTGGAGVIKAFRDPFWFREPGGGREVLLFTGSSAAEPSAWDGVIGLAERVGAGWQLADPLLSAAGLCNELERPHIVAHGGLLYLFWSTLGRVFADGGPRGPNGLYGMVASALDGPWTPLNGSGLVAANPLASPRQSYSWLVLPGGEVVSFVDYPGADDPADAAGRRARFGGVPAPRFTLALDGASTSIR